MTWGTHPVTADRFEDFADVVNRSRRPTHCWCLSHRLQISEIEQLGGGSREQAMGLCEREHPPALVAYRDAEPVGWCNVGLRTEITRLVRCRLIRPVDPPDRMDVTMAFVGTRAIFDRAGFRVVGTTGAVASGLPWLVMRRDLS